MSLASSCVLHNPVNQQIAGASGIAKATSAFAVIHTRDLPSGLLIAFGEAARLPVLAALTYFVRLESSFNENAMPAFSCYGGERLWNELDQSPCAFFTQLIPSDFLNEVSSQLVFSLVTLDERLTNGIRHCQKTDRTDVSWSSADPP